MLTLTRFASCLSIFGPPSGAKPHFMLVKYNSKRSIRDYYLYISGVPGLYIIGASKYFVPKKIPLRVFIPSLAIHRALHPVNLPCVDTKLDTSLFQKTPIQ